MTEREALKLALEALEQINKAFMFTDGMKAITAIKEALAQPEHEFVRGECVKCGASIEKQRPAAWVSEIAEEAELMLEKPRFRAVPLYTTPTQRTWVGLTKEEVSEIAAQGHQRWLDFYDAIEAKLKEKNT